MEKKPIKRQNDFTLEEILFIRRKAGKGIYTLRYLAEKFGCSAGVIAKIRDKDYR